MNEQPGNTFHEEFHTTHVNPLANPDFIEFDWSELYARLGEAESAVSDHDFPAMVVALRVIIGWICEPVNRQTGPEVKIENSGKRAIAMAWLLDPSFFRGSPSARALSAHLKKSRAFVSEPAAEFTRKFRVQNRFQCHGRNGNHHAKLKIN